MKVKAYQVPAECAEPNFELIADDEGRRWSVVTDAGRFSSLSDKHWSVANRPRYWTGELFSVWQSLEAFCAYDERFTDGKRVYFFSGWDGTTEGEDAKREALDLLAGSFGTAWQNADAVLDILCAHAWGDEWVQYGSARRRKEWTDYAAELLTVLTGEKYELREIRGCCQGDYAEVVIASADADELDEIEARYFCTGTDWRVEDEDGGIIAHFYTWKWGEEDAQLVEQVRSYEPEAEVEIFDFDGYEPRVARYKARTAAA